MLDDLYARADSVLDAVTPHAIEVAKAEMRGLLAEAALLGARCQADGVPVAVPAEARQYRALVQLRGTAFRTCKEIDFMSVPGALTVEEAADRKAMDTFGLQAAPYVIRTSIRRV